MYKVSAVLLVKILMQIVTVAEALANLVKGEALVPIDLDVLKPSRDQYRAMICQPGGTIRLSRDGIGHAVPASEAAQFSTMLSRAIANHAEIVVSPEYSVPWLVFDEITHGSLRPPLGCLWALGFESISPAQLEQKHLALAEASNVRLIHEPIPEAQRAHRRFLNPLVYVFWAQGATEAPVLCALVQFKTVPCRDDERIELEFMCRGTNVYKFCNPRPSVELIGLICSDVFEFEDRHVDQNAANVLVLHLQLNATPAHRVFSAYRTRYCATATSNSEILCVNWAAGVLVEGRADPFNEVSGSAWYVSPHAGAVSDDAVNELHRGGVYYSLLERRWHSFYLNYAPGLVEIDKQPVYSTGAQVIAPRLAPRIIARLQWNSALSQWQPAEANDGFEEFIGRYQPLGTLLADVRQADPLSVERALELLSGTDGSPSQWYELPNLQAMHVAEEESMRRFTVSQETNRHRAGVRFRRNRAIQANLAAQVPGQRLAWPKGADDLESGFRFSWHRSRPHCNVEPVTGDRGPATIVWLGDEPDDDELEAVFSKLSKALRIQAASDSLTALEQVVKGVDRLCVLYRRGNALLCYRRSRSVSISEPIAEVEDDIARGDE